MKSLLTAKEVADTMGYSYEYFANTVRHWPQIPKPLDLPGHPRWSREEIEEWSRNHPRIAA